MARGEVKGEGWEADGRIAMAREGVKGERWEVEGSDHSLGGPGSGCGGVERWDDSCKEMTQLCPSTVPPRGPGEAELHWQDPQGWLMALSSLGWPGQPSPGPCITWCPGWSPGPVSPGCAPACLCCLWRLREASRHLSAPGRPTGARQCISGLRGFGG